MNQESEARVHDRATEDVMDEPQGNDLPGEIPADSRAVETVAPTDGASSENRSSANDSVAVRAYALFEERGREHGRDLDDWLEAERELASKYAG
jgi:hypothetical protein